MPNVNYFSSKVLVFAVALATVGVGGSAVNAQSAQTIHAGGVAISGLVDDWTSHRLLFPDPGTERDAIAEGRHDRWLKTVNDPRYVLQQLKRQSTARGPVADDISRAIHFRPPSRISPLNQGPKRDWAVSLGNGTVAKTMFPAKFTWDINAAPNCTKDFVVYGLNVAGTAGGQANLVALNQLYSGTGYDGYCSTVLTAQPYWAYNATTHSGTILTSPELSLDGNEVMYIESTSSGSYLHILIWNSADGGTALASVAPKNTAASVSACKALSSTASCLITVALGSHSITYSSPFYDYANDIIYVGDDNGTLYKVTGVLKGAPAFSTLTVSSGTALTGPIYDSNSGDIFLAGGYRLWAVKASTFALETHPSLTIAPNPCSSGNGTIYDGPIVDGSNGWVYGWVTDNPSDYTAVIQASTGGPSGSGWTIAEDVEVGQGDDGCDSGSVFPTYAPTFDNNYYEGTVTNGHMWVCGRGGGGGTTTDSSGPGLFAIPTSGSNGLMSGTPTHFSSSYISATSHAVCSPITEIYNNGTSTPTDYLFFGEGLSGTGGFGDLYGFTISGATATKISGSPITYPTAQAGTSGITVDNVSSDAQASSIYFTTQAKSTSVCGSTSAFCAVKLTQSALQ